MIKGIVLGIVANCVWGLAFLVPHLLHGTDPLLITAGRFLVYGVIAMVLLPARHRGVLTSLGRRDWMTAAMFAVTGNLGYYAAVVIAIRLAGVPVTALIIGTLPVTMAVYGAWTTGERLDRRLVAPLAAIAAGLLTLNGYKLLGVDPGAGRGGAGLLPGVGFALLALALWTWFGVHNAAYLKRNPHIDGGAWSAMVGCATLPLMLAAMGGLSVTGWWSPAAALRAVIDSGALAAFVVGSIVLGVVVSYVATVLWNQASQVLPVSLSGQLIVFETISSIGYAVLIDRRLPPVAELLCIITVLGGVLMGVRVGLGRPTDEHAPVESLASG